MDYTGYLTWKNWHQNEFGTFSKKDAFYFSALQKKFCLRSYRKILEIGYGNGSFGGWIKMCHSQLSWVGVEANPNLVDRAREAGFDAHADVSKLMNTVDMVIMLDVLEHMEDAQIQNLFNQFESLVAHDGVIVARVPNASGPFGLANQYGDPTHVTTISASRLASYLHSWEISQLKDIRPLYNGSIPRFARELLRSTLRSLLTAAFRFALAPQPPTILESNIILKFRRKN